MSAYKSVWVLAWPKGTTQDFREEPNGPKDFDVISCSPEEKYQYRDGKRTIWGDVMAVFSTRKQAFEYRRQNHYDKSFIILRAELKVGR